jgi:hypothetical protein
MTRSPIERLREAGELRLVRSRWCVAEPGEPDTWREILPAAVGLRLVREGLAVLVAPHVLRPAEKPAGGE